MISLRVHFDLVEISCRVLYGPGLRHGFSFTLVGIRVGFLLDQLMFD